MRHAIGVLRFVNDNVLLKSSFNGELRGTDFVFEHERVYFPVLIYP